MVSTVFASALSGAPVGAPLACRQVLQHLYCEQSGKLDTNDDATGGQLTELLAAGRAEDRQVTSYR